jgi:hypothetical protein
MANAPTAH